MRKLPPFSALRAFESAVRCGTFAAAANDLLLTPTAISHQVRKLEEHLGVRLFHRVGRHVIVTDAGRRYYAALGEAFDQVASATTEIIANGKSDTLSVHAAPSFATLWLTPRLSQFVGTYPEIDVRVSSSARGADLFQDFDIDIQYALPVGPGLVAIPLIEETIVPMCAPGLAMGVRPIRSPADLKGYPLIHSDGCAVHWDDWLKRHPGLHLNLGHGPHFDRSFMSIAAAIDALGVCLDSTFLARDALANGKLVKPFGDDGPTITEHRIVFLKTKAHLPKVRTFVDWVKSIVRGQGSLGLPELDETRQA